MKLGCAFHSTDKRSNVFRCGEGVLLPFPRGTGVRWNKSRSFGPAINTEGYQSPKDRDLVYPSSGHAASQAYYFASTAFQINEMNRSACILRLNRRCIRSVSGHVKEFTGYIKVQGTRKVTTRRHGHDSRNRRSKNMRDGQNMVVLLERHVNRRGHSANNLRRRGHSLFINKDRPRIS